MAPAIAACAVLAVLMGLCRITLPVQGILCFLDAINVE